MTKIPPTFGGVPDLAKLAGSDLRSAEASPQSFHPVIDSVTVRLKPNGHLSRDDYELIAAYARAAAVEADRIPSGG